MADYNPNARDERESQLQKRGREAEKFIGSVNWTLLKQQYEELSTWKAQQAEDFKGHESWASQKSWNFHKQQQAMLESTLLLLEAIKDLAVDHFGVDAVTVFGEKQK